MTATRIVLTKLRNPSSSETAETWAVDRVAKKK
jgi:hypothetical protein